MVGLCRINKTKNTASYSSKTKTAEEKIVHLWPFFVLEACGKILKSPILTKAIFFSYQLCGQVCRPRFINTRISASFLPMQCSTLFFCLFWYSPKSFLVLYVVLCWFSQMVHKFLQKRGLLLLHFIIELGVHLDYFINYNILKAWNK